jgi:hypothetical protein
VRRSGLCGNLAAISSGPGGVPVPAAGWARHIVPEPGPRPIPGPVVRPVPFPGGYGGAEWPHLGGPDAPGSHGGAREDGWAGQDGRGAVAIGGSDWRDGQRTDGRARPSLVVPTAWGRSLAGTGRSSTTVGRSVSGRGSSICDSSLIATRSANAGQPAITRPTRSAPAAATLAARLAAVPAASAAHGSQPEDHPVRRSASRTREATISMPSTDSGKVWACHPVSPWAAASSRT